MTDPALPPGFVPLPASRTAHVDPPLPPGFVLETQLIPQGTEIPAGPRQSVTPLPSIMQFDRTMDARRATNELVVPNLPMIAGGAASMVPGLNLGMAALAAGGGGSAGEALRRVLTGEPVEPGPVLKEGAKQGAFQLVGGAFFKGLQTAFGKAKPAAEKAIALATAKGAPLPDVSSAAAGATNAARLPALGDVAAGQQATKITQFLNSHIDEIAPQAVSESLDDVVMNAKTVLADRLDARAGYESVLATLGKQTQIPLNNTVESLRKAADAALDTGDQELSGKLLGLVTRYDKKGGGVLSADRLNGFMSALYRMMTPTTKEVLEGVVEGIGKDMDEVAKLSGTTDIAEQLKRAHQAFHISKRFARENPGVYAMAKGADTPNKFMVRFANSPGVRGFLKKAAPEVHDELANAWLAKNVSGYLRGDVPNGRGLAKFIEDNNSALVDMFGAQRVTALDNFAAYVEWAQPFLKRTGGEASQMLRTPLSVTTRVAAEFWKAPITTLAAEPAAFMFVKSLTNPNSPLFQLFATGLPESFVTAGRAGGAAAGNAGDKLMFADGQSAMPQ